MKDGAIGFQDEGVCHRAGAEQYIIDIGVDHIGSNEADCPAIAQIVPQVIEKN